MKDSVYTRLIAAVAVLTMSASLAVVEADGAKRTRPGGSSSGSSASGRSSNSAGSGGSSGAGRTRVGGGSSSSSSTRVRGKASYGHYRGGYHHGHHYRPWWPYYGSYLGWYYWSYYPHYYPWYPMPTVHVYAIPENSPAAVEIDIRPKRSMVMLDGEEIGKAKYFNGTWDLLWLEPGVYELEFAHEGYQTLRLHLRVRAGRRYHLTDRLEKGEGLDPRSTKEAPPAPAPAATPSPRRGSAPADEAGPPASAGKAETLKRGLLRIRVTPADAAVYLDGEFLARAGELARLHGALPVAVGVHRIEAVRPGYAGREVEVRVTEEEPALVELDLERE